MARRRNGRKRKGRGEELWLLVAVVVVVVGVALWRFVSAYPGWAIAIAVVLLAVTGGGLYLRHRIIEADRRRFLAANTELERVDRLTGPQFERLIAERLHSDGFRQVARRGGTGDGGVDITANAFGHGRYAVQCKRYRGTVGAPEVRNFLGALANAFSGHTGILVTSGTLTRQAKAEAAAARQPLIIVERDELADWLLGGMTLLPAPPRRPLTEGEFA
ncbi:restriction endonuclease [Herbidospora mongoliensis]|uniref:restriction endonuclease n=1 Tax=Herbidospora mongoliensis TaxID=688067 RepID=UPI0009FBA2B6|nr:restriction endonuclease [Herbidospora mongoliensis]